MDLLPFVLRTPLFLLVELLMDKEEITAAEIWEIFKKAPRIPQVSVILDLSSSTCPQLSLFSSAF